MKIGILGSGNMGRSLGILWAEQGHEVFFGARSSDKGKSVAESAGHGSRGGTIDEAADFGEVVLHTVRDVAPSTMLSSTSALSGKVLIDCNNRAIPDGFAYGPLIDESHAERLAADLPDTHVVKAFNTMAMELFELSPNPLKENNVSCFVCSDNEKAKKTVMQLAEEIGFSSVDCGPLRSARMLEALGDFIRFVMGGMELGPFATISVHQLPEAKSQRLGGRKPGL